MLSKKEIKVVLQVPFTAKITPWSDVTSGSDGVLSWSAMGKLACRRIFPPALISLANIRVILNMVFVLPGFSLFVALVYNVPEGLEGV